MLADDGPPCQELGRQSAPLHVFHVRGSEKQHIGKLSLFEHRLACNNSIGVMYAGGHISALNFHPSYNSLCALAAHRHDRPKHDILKCYKGSAHIQLWTLSLQPGNTHFLGVIPHNGNCTWDLKWRPDTFQTSHSSIGTLAAALGDGTAIVATFEDFDLPDFSSVPDQASSKTIFTLRPKIMTLRAQKKAHQRRPVRVAEWSPDGTRLVLGIADGSIEVYEASSNEKVWPRWCIPAQESVITGVRWMNSSYLCSVSISCVLSVRDIRNPISSLEQNAESLAGSMAMEAVEPDVAVVGTDSGTLRVVKLSAIEGVFVKQPVKRIYLQTNTVRDIQAVSEAGTDTVIPYTRLYAGGSEGIVHECVLPRPIWPNPDTCHLPRTETQQKLRWKLRPSDALQKEPSLCLNEISAHTDSSKPSNVSPIHHTNTDPILDLCVGDDYQSSEELTLLRHDSTVIDDDACPTEEHRKIKRRKRAAGREYMERDSNAPKTVLFGPELEQRTTITRIGLSQKDDLIAVGIDDGIVTWTTMKGEEMETPFIQRFKSPMFTSKPKKLKSPAKKRGRPRKQSFPDLIAIDEAERVKSRNAVNEGEEAEGGIDAIGIKTTEDESPMPTVKILGPRRKHVQQASLKETEKDSHPTEKGEPPSSIDTAERSNQKRKRKKEDESQTKRKTRKLKLSEGNGQNLRNTDIKMVTKLKTGSSILDNKKQGKGPKLSSPIITRNNVLGAAVNESGRHKRSKRKTAIKQTDLDRVSAELNNTKDVRKDERILLRLRVKAATPVISKKGRVNEKDKLRKIKKPSSNKLSVVTLKLRLRPAKLTNEDTDHDLRSEATNFDSKLKDAHCEKVVDANAKMEDNRDGTTDKVPKVFKDGNKPNPVFLRLPIKRKQDERHNENNSTPGFKSPHEGRDFSKSEALQAVSGHHTKPHKNLRVDEEEGKDNIPFLGTNHVKVTNQPIAAGTGQGEKPDQRCFNSINNEYQDTKENPHSQHHSSNTTTNGTTAEQSAPLKDPQGTGVDSTNSITKDALDDIEINQTTPIMIQSDGGSPAPSHEDQKLSPSEQLEDTEHTRRRPSRARRPSWRLRQ